MRFSLSFITLFRTPLKTFLTFILFAVVTFAFFTQVAEYSIMNREVVNASKEYHGTGSAEVTPVTESHPDAPFYIKADPRMTQNVSDEERKFILEHYRYHPLSQAQIHSIDELPLISSSNTRYMSPGVSDKYYRMDEGENYYNYTARFIIEGTLSEVKYGLSGDNFNHLVLNDCALLAGNLPWPIADQRITILANSDKSKGTLFNTGPRITMWYQDDYIYETEYIKKLSIGGRYVFVGRFEPLGDPAFYLGDHLTDSWCESVQALNGHPENYLETTAFTPLRELVEITDSDLHTFDVVYTDDMSAILRFAEGDMQIASGRALMKKDDLNQSKVCVVSHDFASSNNLNLGDKITLRLGTELFEQYKGLGSIAATKERYTKPERVVELEIVGIYTDTDGSKKQLKEPNWCYSINTVFVPESLLPQDERQPDSHEFSPSEWSFTVDAWNISAFMEEIEERAPDFEAMGFKIIFDDAGWPEIVDEFETSKKLSGIAIIAVSAALFAAIWFILFLFISRKKKEYAIMRALGTTRGKSAGSLLLPLMSLTISAVIVGSVAAWFYTVNTVEKNAALSIMKDYEVNTSIPLGSTIGWIAIEIALVLLLALLELWRIGRLPPLVLLQDSHSRQGFNKGKIQGFGKTQGSGKSIFVPDTAKMIHRSDMDASDVREIHKPRSCRFILRYISKHMRRAVGKSILSLLLAALLFGGVGQFALTRQSYLDLCNGTVITARFINGLPLVSITQIIKTGYVKDPYYESVYSAIFNSSETDFIVTNDIARYTGEETEITYAEGYDASCMQKVDKVCIAGKKLLEQNGLKPGDKVHIAGTLALHNLQAFYINQYRTEHPGETLSDEVIIEKYKDEIAKKVVNEGSYYYTIAGSVTTPSSEYDNAVFTPGTYMTKPIFGSEIDLDIAEFTLADNLRADEFRSFAEKMTGGILSGQTAFAMDTSKIENLLNILKLLEKLFPVVIVASFLIGGLICSLLIIQSSREVAILRILGTTKRKTHAILIMEQLFLCIIGLACGACGLLSYKGAALSGIAGQLGLFAALYFVSILISSLIVSAITTRRHVLELLHTKE